MPTYEYQCPQGHRFEKFQKMSDKPGAKCPTCGKPAARLISGGAGLVFRGSGFYITDYGKDGKGPRKPEKTEKPENPPSPRPNPRLTLSRGNPKPSPPRRPPASERPAPRRARPGRRDAGGRRHRLRPRAAARHRPRRPGHQPRHGHRAPTTDQAPPGGGAGGGRAASAARAGRADRDRWSRLHQLLARGGRARLRAPPHPRRGARLRPLGGRASRSR